MRLGEKYRPMGIAQYEAGSMPTVGRSQSTFATSPISMIAISAAAAPTSRRGPARAANGGFFGYRHGDQVQEP
jgi:hypothetical protein